MQTLKWNKLTKGLSKGYLEKEKKTFLLYKKDDMEDANDWILECTPPSCWITVGLSLIRADDDADNVAWGKKDSDLKTSLHHFNPQANSLVPVPTNAALDLTIDVRNGKPPDLMWNRSRGQSWQTWLHPIESKPSDIAVSGMLLCCVALVMDNVDATDRRCRCERVSQRCVGLLSFTLTPISQSTHPPHPPSPFVWW